MMGANMVRSKTQSFYKSLKPQSSFKLIGACKLKIYSNWQLNYSYVHQFQNLRIKKIIHF
jgi:hypothetical protein